MRSIDLSKPFNRLSRLLAGISVRTRIVVLALIPVVGFLANGMMAVYVFIALVIAALKTAFSGA